MIGRYISKFTSLIGYRNRSFLLHSNQSRLSKVLLFTVVFAIYSIMASQSQVKELSKGISAFATDFYQECAQTKPGDNIIISPLSVASALALLSQGTGGNTFVELNRGLHLNGDKEATANQFHEYYALLQKSVGKSTLSIANQIYVQHGHTINANFKDVAVKKFSSGIESLNFANAVDSAKTINKFVEQKTKDKIKDLIKADMLSSDTRAVLVNAIYFKGNWEYQFNKDRTSEGDFYTSETETIPVDFMRIKKNFNYGVLDGLDATALEMEYANSSFSFVIVLPNKRTGLSDMESKLKSYDLAKLSNQMYSQEVEVTIPKFKVEFEINLNDVLKKLGMAEMFTRKADLSGILETGEPLYVSDVVHKAFIEVNEEGSEAAAATGAVSRAKRSIRVSDPIFFDADHPFVYFIKSARTDELPVFYGTVQRLIADSCEPDHDEL